MREDIEEMDGDQTGLTFMYVQYVPTNTSIEGQINQAIALASSVNKFAHLLPDATLSHMVKECRKLSSTFLCSRKRDKKTRFSVVQTFQTFC
jgi:hypothetical protein